MREQPMFRVVLDDEQPRPFEDAERILLVEASGQQTLFVLLAALDVHGRDYVMLARESELVGSDEEDMPVYLFELDTSEDGEPMLQVIDDDDTYAEVFHLFAELSDDDEEPVLDDGDDYN